MVAVATPKFFILYGFFCAASFFDLILNREVAKRKIRPELTPTSPQVDDSGYQIPRNPAGKMWESHRILQEKTGNRWNMEAVFRPELVRFFSGGFLSTSCAFRQETIGKNPKNFRSEYCFHKITRITRNRQFPDRVVRPGSIEVSSDRHDFSFFLELI